MKPRIYRRNPLNRHLGRARIAAKFTPVVSNAKKISMQLFAWWSFIFLMHHTPIKTTGYVTDVIVLKKSAAIDDVKT